MTLLINENAVDLVTVERPWTERWLTWPWRPWIKTRVHRQPIEGAIIMDSPLNLPAGREPLPWNHREDEKFIVMHPDVWERYCDRKPVL